MTDRLENSASQAAPSKQSLDERMKSTIEQINHDSEKQCYFFTADSVIGATLTEWDLLSDGMQSMFQPLNNEEIQARLQNAKAVSGQTEGAVIAALERRLQKNFAIIRTGAFALSNTMTMVFENVMIDRSIFVRNKVVGGTVKVIVKNDGSTGAVHAADDPERTQENVYSVQFTDRQVGSDARYRPRFFFNGKDLSPEIETDRSQAMAALAEVWRRIMLLYPQATLDVKEKQKIQREQGMQEVTDAAKQKLVEIGLAGF